MKPTCYHQRKRAVWTTVTTHAEPLAVRQLRYQCEDCGKLLAQALPHSSATPDTPNVDIEAVRRWVNYDREFWSRGQQERQRLLQQSNEEWRDRYETYLQSDAWKARRRLVFERSDFLCEGCRLAKAKAVHHLTYDHLGNEPLWELVAVCQDCHDKVHGK